MNLKLAIVDDNTFLIHAIKEKLSFFEDISIRHTALNGSELLTKLEESPSFFAPPTSVAIRQPPI